MALTTFVAGNVLTALQLNDSFAAVGGARAVVPTSVTVTGGGSSGTVGTNGTVTFGTAASVSINGCFSSAFRNYFAVMDFDASAGGVNMQTRLRVGGVDNTTASSYVAQRVAINSTTVSGLRQTLDTWVTGSSDSTSTNALWWQFVRPNLADQTGMWFMSLDSYLSAYQTEGCGTHNQATAYDGFTVYPNTGTITGTITVYGLFGQ